jgi:uracil-DNA glycosylase family 4
MCHSNKVLSSKNGSIDTKVLFIAEAPGRLGADRTSVPLFGDATGHNFSRLLNTVGIRREDIFITNAILCNPKKENGNNDTPKENEIQNCSTYLNILIELIKPEFIVTIGLTALKSLNFIEPHNISLRNDVSKIKEWNGYKLIPLYHVGPMAMIHRSYHHQVADYFFLKRTIRTKKAKKGKSLESLRTAINADTSKLQKTILYIMSVIRKASKFKVAKLIYLLDYEYIKSNNRLFTDAFYIRQQQGPLQVSLTDDLKNMQDKYLDIWFENKKPNYSIKENIKINVDLNKNDINYINLILEKYGQYDDGKLFRKVYLTTPMKRLLRQERNGIKPTYNKPLFVEEDFKSHRTQEDSI